MAVGPPYPEGAYYSRAKAKQDSDEDALKRYRDRRLEIEREERGKNGDEKVWTVALTKRMAAEFPDGYQGPWKGPLPAEVTA